MRKHYCFQCGSYTEIDNRTSLCGRCYRGWLARVSPSG